MEMAMAAMSSLAGGVSTAVTSVGSALGLTSASAPMALAPAAAGATGSSPGSFFASLLQGGAGLVGAMSAMRAGRATAAAYRSQAADTRLEVNQEAIDATDRQTSLRKQLVAALGERQTAYAASGVDLTFGTPQQAQREAIVTANDVISRDQSTSDIRRSRLRARADTLDAMASDAEDAGAIKGLGIGLSTAGALFARG